MSHSLTHLAGLKVSTEEFLATVLETVAQPIWVVDSHDVIRFVNPAAIAALGYDDADELLGRQSHETIQRPTGETVASDLDWFVRPDGSMFQVSYSSS